MRKGVPLPILVAGLCIIALAISWSLVREREVGPPEEESSEEVLQRAVEPAEVAEETLAHARERRYIEVIESCYSGFDGAPCVRSRTGPGTSYDVVGYLRNGIVLLSDGVVEAEGRTWYKVIFDEPLRYPERVTPVQYVAAEFVRPFIGNGIEIAPSPSKAKHILIDRSEQKLFAYEGEELFMEAVISTGLELTPTPRGTFTIYKKTPTRYMQGPLPGITEKEYDLPGVPWNLYFTKQGGVIHGAYWHEKFGEPASNGCVNLTPIEAERLYWWANVGTPVRVRD